MAEVTIDVTPEEYDYLCSWGYLPPRSAPDEWQFGGAILHKAATAYRNLYGPPPLYWTRDGVKVPGTEAAATFTLTLADVGHTVAPVYTEDNR